MSDAKEARRTAKMLERITKEMAKRPNLVKTGKVAGKTAIAVADLFAPIPGGKVRTGLRASKAALRAGKTLKKVKNRMDLRNTMQLPTEKLRHAWEIRALKNTFMNEAQKAALASAGIGAAAKTVYDKVKSKRKKK